MYLAGIINQDGLVDGALAARIAAHPARQAAPSPMSCATASRCIAITQNDVRAIQLAKAALYAGARLLMDKLGIDSVDRIRLAGAFGSHIDVKYAMVLGLIPDCAARQGAARPATPPAPARASRCSTRRPRDEIEQVVRRIEKIETAVEPQFQQHFVEAMAIPHKTGGLRQSRQGRDPAGAQGHQKPG